VAVQRHSGSIFLNFKACDASTVCTEISSAIRFEVRCGHRGVEFIPLPNLRISRQDRAIFSAMGKKTIFRKYSKLQESRLGNLVT
jgi:hypothetical protein